MQNVELFHVLTNGTAEVMSHAWPGGYPIFFVCDDGGCLCPDCVANNLYEVGRSSSGDGWNVVALDINYEDPELFCDHCSERIKSAYAED